MELEEDHLVVGFNQVVEKKDKRHGMITTSTTKFCSLGSLVLLYDRKYFKHPNKLCMHWLGPFLLVYISEVGATKLATLQGQPLKGLVNGSRLKVYYGPQGSHTT
jgi:hypothetical protein